MLVATPRLLITDDDRDFRIFEHLFSTRRDQLARDFDLPPSMLTRYRPGHSRHLPEGSPGSVGYPSLASAQKGERLYRFILDRVSSCLTRS